MRPATILFAKAPIPGRVKTRLAALLGFERAAALHAAFVRDMLEKLHSLSDITDLELHTDMATDAWPEHSVTRKMQSDGHLQLKMFHALKYALQEGRTRAMIVGSDAPTLPCSHLRILLESTADVALGPSEDGGYYAISSRKVHPEMFRGVTWSTSAALEQTEQAVRLCGLTVERGAMWHDVDEPADLLRLARTPALPRHTAAWLLEQRLLQ